MFGANIGTTMTGILAAIGGTTAGKRTAALHTTLNVISTIVGMLLLKPYAALIQSLFGGLNPMMQIAMANIVFKLVTTFLFLPFTKQLVAFVRKVVPGEEPKEIEVNIEEMDEEITNILPSAAVDAAKQAILKMIDVIRFHSTETIRFLNEKGGDEEKEELDKKEAITNRFDQKITDYLIRLSTKPNLTAEDINDVRASLDAVKNFERVGDLAVNLSEFFNLVFKDGEFSEAAITEMNKMLNKYLDMFDLTAEIFMTKDYNQYTKLLVMEHDLDNMEAHYRRKHFKRMAEGTCGGNVAASVYSDILGTIERMGDHCCNAAKSSVTGLTSDLSDDEVVA